MSKKLHHSTILNPTTATIYKDTLFKSNVLQDAIFNSSYLLSIVTDVTGIIQIFNVGAERMLGYTVAEVVNKITPADILNSVSPDFESLVATALYGIEDSYELTFVRKDGSYLPMVVSVTALCDDENTVTGYLFVGTDNTALKHAEAELQNLHQVLQQKNIELDDTNLAKSDFLTNMSHELRTPLNAILGFAQLIETDPTPTTATQKENIEHILQAGWHLLDLINEILDLTLIESGNVSLSIEPTSLREVLIDCQAMIEPKAQKQGIRLSFPKLDNPYFADVDQSRIKQVLINLLSNAIKYNRPEGMVKVTCNMSTPDKIHISVQDTGEGLSPQKLTQLFQPFNRFGQETEGIEGTGIGLVMAKRLVELMGGTIGVKSTVGVGSVFWIEVKLAVEISKNQAQVQQDVVPLHTLLYVEDNRANIKLVEEIMTRHPDIRLLSTANGSYGIELARIHQPVVILMDINLPGINGYEALTMLKENSITAHIPVIAVSANAMPGDVERGMTAGFFRYLIQPIKGEILMNAIEMALEFSGKKLNTAVPSVSILKPSSMVDILNANILIVDDLEANVTLLEQMLRGAGYTSITSTTNSYKVYELHHKNRYDLILLDLQMPGMDGFQVMEELKRIELSGYLPVLAVSAHEDYKLRALQEGAKDFLSKPFNLPEVLTRIHNLLEVRLLHKKSTHQSLVLEQSVQVLRETTLEAKALVEKTEQARVEMTHLAQHDTLTGLPNRILLNDRLVQTIAMARRQGKQFAVMFLDLDHFKYINDTYGHAIGDQLLQSVATRLNVCIRNSDTVCRQGGDEFVILLTNVGEPDDVALTARKILTALAVPHFFNQIEINATVSIGISLYPNDGLDADALTKNADIAMYRAKEGGRNNYQFFK